MSLGYAEKLSYIEDVGKVGMAKFFDSSSVLQEKGKHQVVFTAAGILTSCGIPDFQGPKGILTLQHEGKPLPEASLPFRHAMPSMTHMALVELEKAGTLKFLISQNVDGLHLRSETPREKLAELHGNTFMETCPACGAEYLGNFDVETTGLTERSRRCSNVHCGVKLKDTVLDCGGVTLVLLPCGMPCPPKETNLAEKHCQMADVVLCLGARCYGLLLNLRIPPYISVGLFQTILGKSLSADERYVNWNIRLASVHGLSAPLPFIKSIEVSFSENHKWKETIIIKKPFQLKRRTGTSERFEIFLKLNLIEGCGRLYTQITIPFDFKASSQCFKHDTDPIFQKLKDNAVQDSCSGQTKVIERKVTLAPRTETTVSAIVTNIKAFDYHSSKGDVKLQKKNLNGPRTSRKQSHKPRP